MHDLRRYEFKSYRKLFYSSNHNQLSQQQNIPCASKHVLSCLTITNEQLHHIEHMYSVDYTARLNCAEGASLFVLNVSER